jgi:ABC-2 type transport system ATP-binding protein
MSESPADPAIMSAQLTKRYPGGTMALRGVDLRVEQGEVFGLLGPNGAGKSTFIRILLDMIRPTAGRAAVLGHDTQADSVGARGLIGYLPGNPRFPARMTATDLFGFVREVRGLHGDARTIAYTDTLVHRLEIDIDRPIRTLSRGNQQKVGLAVALMSRPQVVILDEPTSGLDPLMQEVATELVREVAAEGRTVFFSSHILPEVEAVCHRVAILREGALAGVFDLDEQRRLAPRRVVVAFDTLPPPEAFADLAGVTLMASDAKQLTFEVRDGFDGLVKQLSRFTVVNLESHEPTLEDFFVSLYERAPDDRSVVAR